MQELKKKTKGLYKTGKQIRSWIPTETYKQLKREAKSFKIDLNEYSGLILQGIRLIKQKREENQLDIY